VNRDFYFGGDTSESAFSGRLLHGCLFEKLRGFGWIDVFLRTEVYGLPLFFSGPFYALWCSPVRLTVGDVPEARPDTATCIFSQPNTLSYRSPIAELMQVREQKRGCTDSGGVLHRRGC
jgi:hypothetical protein